MKRFCWLVSFAVCLAAGGLCAYTPAETNDVVKGMLFYVVQLGSYDNFTDDRGIVIKGPNPDTWEGFLGGGRDGSWTTAERKAAFDWYLSTLGTSDFTSSCDMDKKLVHAALTRCEVFNYSNSVPSLRALALNPKGVWRHKAIKLALGLSTIDASTTAFVEMLVTNVVSFSSVERGIACGVYAEDVLLLSRQEKFRSQVEDAVRMFYRNRSVDVIGTEVVDDLFVQTISGYRESSNRLEFATQALSQTDCPEEDQRYFAGVTNDLISLCHPLTNLTSVVFAQGN